MQKDVVHPTIDLLNFFLWVLLLLDFHFLYLLFDFLLLALLFVLLAALVTHDTSMIDGFPLLQMMPMVGLQCQSNLHIFSRWAEELDGRLRG